MTTPGTAGPNKRTYWITAEALRGFRERVKGYPNIEGMEDDQLADVIDALIVRGMKAELWEDIEDGGEAAKLVMIHTVGSEGFYALLKKSNNKKNFDQAAVVVLTQSQVGQYRKSRWLGGRDKEGDKLSSIPQPVKNPGSGPISLPVEISPRRTDARTILLSYIPIKKNGDDNLPRVYEEYSTAREVETRLGEIKAVPNTVRVYRELAIALKIVD
jgi:hypothetical protein